MGLRGRKDWRIEQVAVEPIISLPPSPAIFIVVIATTTADQTTNPIRFLWFYFSYSGLSFPNDRNLYDFGAFYSKPLSKNTARRQQKRPNATSISYLERAEPVGRSVFIQRKNTEPVHHSNIWALKVLFYIRRTLNRNACQGLALEIASKDHQYIFLIMTTIKWGSRSRICKYSFIRIAVYPQINFPYQISN